jgi:hypothetical protein
MTFEMTTAMWIVFAVVGLQLAALGCLWILYLIKVHSGARNEQPQEHPARQPRRPPRSRPSSAHLASRLP